MAEEKSLIEGRKELSLNDNGVLRPPPRRKKSLKKTKMDAEKSRQNIRPLSTNHDNDNNSILKGKQLSNEGSKCIAEEITKDSVGVLPGTTQPLGDQHKSPDHSSSIDQKCTNDIPAEDSKVEEEQSLYHAEEMATDTQTLSITSNRNLHIKDDSKLSEHDDMGNKNSSSKSKFHASLSASWGESELCAIENEGSSIPVNHNVEITSNVETFCWVADVSDSEKIPKQTSTTHVQTASISSTKPTNTEILSESGANTNNQPVTEFKEIDIEQALHDKNATNDVKDTDIRDDSINVCSKETLEGNDDFVDQNSKDDNLKNDADTSIQEGLHDLENKAQENTTTNAEAQEFLNNNFTTKKSHLTPNRTETTSVDKTGPETDDQVKPVDEKNTVPYQTLAENMSSEDICERWEDDNISSDTDTDDSDAFYSDWSISEEGENMYNIQLAEKMYGAPSSSSDDQNSIPRTTSSSDPVSEILSVFPNTEYLTVADDRGTENNSNQGDSNLGDGFLGDLDLSQARAESLKRKIGSFKVVKQGAPIVSNDEVKEAAVAVPSDSYEGKTSSSSSTDEAEKAIQALHQKFLKQVHRDSKSEIRKSKERIGESAVYFTRAPVSNLNQDNDSSKMDKKLEISRPRSICGEPRLRSLSAGDISGLNQRYSVPMRAKSWKDENDERLYDLSANLKDIIGSLGRLEDSRERRDSGSPLFAHVHKKQKVELEMVAEGESVNTNKPADIVSEPCVAEVITSDVFEEAPDSSDQLFLNDTLKDFKTNEANEAEIEIGPGKSHKSDESEKGQQLTHLLREDNQNKDEDLVITGCHVTGTLDTGSDLGTSGRPLSMVPEEGASLLSSSRGSSISQESKEQEDEGKSEKPKSVGEPSIGINDSEQTPDNLLDIREESKLLTPVYESTPKRPRSLEIHSDPEMSSSCADDRSTVEVLDFTDGSSAGSYNLSTNQELNQSGVTEKNPKDSIKNNSHNEVQLRDIKMSKGRRPFSAIEPRNIPTSPTEKVVQLKSFRSHISGYTVDSPDSGEPGTEQSTNIEMAEEVFESSPKRPPRTKGKLTHSASFASSPSSREKVTKRTKPMTKSRSRWQTLSEADWLRVSLSAKPDLVHEGPVTLVTDALPASIPNFPMHKRAQVALELYTTERTYVRGLETVIELFKTPLENYLDSKEMEGMFGNISGIYQLNKDVLFTLCEKVTHWNDEQIIGDVFVDLASRFKIYASYCTNYEAADNLIKQKIKRKKDFENFLNSCYSDPVCEPGITLQAYLVTVVQRIPRYILLLKDLDRYTPAHHPDKKPIVDGLQKMINIAEYLNNQVQNVHGLRAMSELRSRFIGIEAFETPGRPLVLIKEGEVSLMNTKKAYTCLLLSDWMLFAAKNAKKNKEVLELGLELKTLWVCDLDDNDPQTNIEDAIELYTPERSYTMYAKSRNEKKHWLQKIRTAIAIQLHGEEATDSSEIATRKAAFTFKDGRIYCGHFVDSKTHGYGVLAWPNRTRYDGDFEDGERNGTGELSFNTGEKYKGEWKDDKQHGNGTLTYPNGDVYSGEWKEGKMHGKGLIKFSNNDVLSGEFVDSEVCGWAKLECSNNLFYEGTWKHSKKHGKGKLIKHNGDTYEGEFHNDRIHGRGKMVYAKTKATYEGQWENNHRHGTGTFIIPNGAQYEGEWSADHIQGWGTMVYGNGEVYEGSWFRDMRFGKGNFKTHDGVYDGHFEYNLRHKFGLMQYKDGSEYEGEWQNDQREGQGKMIYADAGIYEGYWFHNLRHGRGKMSYPNGATFEGMWDLDSPHGSEGIYVDQASNYSYEGEWIHGRKEGRGVEKTANCTYDGDFKANVRHGKGVETLKGGVVFEGKWRDNRKVGEGVRRTRWGNNETTEIQQWKEGQLFNKDESVAPDLPFLQRH